MILHLIITNIYIYKMEKNCLLTRLKGVADNSNLPIFGEFKVLITKERYYDNEFNVQRIINNFSNPEVPVTYSLSNGAVFTTDNNGIIGTSQITLTPVTNKAYGIYNPNKYAVLTISDKYNASVIVGDDALPGFDNFSELRYNKLQVFGVGAYFKGDIESLKDWNSIVYPRFDLSDKAVGNLCYMPRKTMYCYARGAKTFTWQSVDSRIGPDAYALALNNVILTPEEIDRYLIDTAECAWGQSTNFRTGDFTEINVGSTTGVYIPGSNAVKTAISNLYSSMRPNIGDTPRVSGSYFQKIRIAGIDMSTVIQD